MECLKAEDQLIDKLNGTGEEEMKEGGGRRGQARLYGNEYTRKSVGRREWVMEITQSMGQG